MRLPWTPWNAVEFNNSTRALCSRGLLAPASLRALPAQLKQAFAADDLRAKPLPSYLWWHESELVSRAHTTKFGVRTLDVLHVAAARVLGADAFISFDSRQRDLAKAAGLKVLP
jgi:predicted nucleic acid-binding protein